MVSFSCKWLQICGRRDQYESKLEKDRKFSQWHLTILRMRTNFRGRQCSTTHRTKKMVFSCKSLGCLGMTRFAIAKRKTYKHTMLQRLPRICTPTKAFLSRTKWTLSNCQEKKERGRISHRKTNWTSSIIEQSQTSTKSLKQIEFIPFHTFSFILIIILTG